MASRIAITLTMLAGCWTGNANAPATTPPAASAEAPASARTPAPRRPAARRPPRCEVLTDAPVRATSMGTLRVHAPPGDSVVAISMSMRSINPGGVSMASTMTTNTGMSPSMTLSPGTYTLDLQTEHLRVRCDQIEVISGAETTVRIVGG